MVNASLVGAGFFTIVLGAAVVIATMINSYSGMAGYAVAKGVTTYKKVTKQRTKNNILKNDEANMLTLFSKISDKSVKELQLLSKAPATNIEFNEIRRQKNELKSKLTKLATEHNIKFSEKFLKNLRNEDFIKRTSKVLHTHNLQKSKKITKHHKS